MSAPPIGKSSDPKLTGPAKATPPASPSAASANATPLMGEVRILIVDESSADRFLLRTALIKAGLTRYQIFECSDAATAMDLAQRYSPDAILLDYRLPTEDGISIIPKLSAVCPDAAFLIITRQGDEAAAVRAMKTGASDYLVKDQVLYDPIRIDRAVQSAIYLKSLERENSRILEALRQRNLELEQLTSRLWELSHTDELTGFFNRRFITQRLEDEMHRAQRYHMPLSIVIMDLDYFKRVNDTYGHLAGDRALQTVAQLIRSALRDTDLIGRWGGEEFMLILTNTDNHGAITFCNRLCERIRHHPICIGETVLCLTSSFGVASLSEDMKKTEDLVRRADHNLYRAKAMGRDCVVADETADLSDTLIEWGVS